MVGLIQVWFFKVGAMKEQMDKKKKLKKVKRVERWTIKSKLNKNEVHAGGE